MVLGTEPGRSSPLWLLFLAGKTRLLYEASSYLPIVEFESVIITYGNGHSPTRVEWDSYEFPIEASFSWRILFFLFFAHFTDASYASVTTEELPSNLGRLTFPKVIAVLRLLKGYPDDKALHLFIGLDEFQVLRKIRSDALPTLLKTFLGTMSSKTLLYPLLTGTAFSSGASSSEAFCPRIPLGLLSFRETEEAIRSIPPINGVLPEQVIHQPPFRRALLTVSGIPRLFIQFTKGLMKNVTPTEPFLTQEMVAIELTKVSTQHSPGSTRLPISPREKLFLVAYSLSGRAVDETASPRFLSELKVTWQQLHDACYCIIGPAKQVQVPYLFMLDCAKATITADDPPCLTALSATIRHFIDYVDARLVLDEPWQSWEEFGLHYWALKINSLLTIGQSTVRFSTLIGGALFQGCDQEVVLQPVEVDYSAVPFSATMPSTIGNLDNPHAKINWFKEGKIWKNKACGKGVDIFFALRTTKENTYVVCVDQRKKIADSLGPGHFKDLLELANIHPTDKECQFILVRGLVHVLPRFNQKKQNKIPSNCFLVTSQQTREFHTSLFCHPAASPTVNINDAVITHLKLVLNYNEDCAKEIHNRATTQPFHDEEELRQFISKKFPEMRSESIRWEQMEF